MQRGFEPLGRRRAQPLEVVDAIRLSRFGNAFEAREFGLFCGDDQHANLGMGNPVPATIRVQTLAPGDTAARLQTSRRVVKPGMNDLAVA